MPKSKREKEVSLTKVKKKTKETKSNIMSEVRECVGNYSNLFVVRIEDLRSSIISKVRQDLKQSSRMFFGKNNLLSAALGKNEESEIANDLHKVAESLKGECLLLFTNNSSEEIKKYFAEFSEADFTRAGTIAEETIEFNEGPLFEMPGSLESQLRKLGMPVKLEKGEIHLVKDFPLCKEGEIITSEQSRLLKLFDFKLAKVKFQIVAQWSKNSGFLPL